MTVMTELPKDLRPCEVCGHDPGVAKRLHYFAGCPDDHEVHVFDDVAWLSQAVAHVWPDRTYAAMRADDFAVRPDDRERILLAWLDRCHDGRVPRHARELGCMIEYDPLDADLLAPDGGAER